MQNKMPLIVALILGLIAAFGVYKYVKGKEAELAAQLQGRPVVSASQDIPKGTELTMDLVSAKTVPDSFIPPQAIEGSDNVKLIMGRKARVDVSAGQVILWSDLEAENRGGFSTLIPEGERAFAVEISRGVKGGALLQPNDHVDIIGTFTAARDAAPKAAGAAGSAALREQPEVVNAVLLQNVTVLAVGENFGGRPAQEGQAGGELTLSLTLPEAQLLMFAQEHGELGAVLRREGDIRTEAREKLPRISFKDLETVVGNLDVERKKRIVQIQKGQTVEEVTVEPK